MAESLVKDHNLSLMVLDRSTNNPLGVMLNGVFHRDEIDTPPSEVKITKTQKSFAQQFVSFQVIASCIDPRFAPIASILHKVQIKSRDFFYNNNMETAFDLKVGVGSTDDDIGQFPSADVGGPPQCQRSGSGQGHDREVSPAGQVSRVQDVQDGGHGRLLQESLPQGGLRAGGRV